MKIAARLLTLSTINLFLHFNALALPLNCESIINPLINSIAELREPLIYSDNELLKLIEDPQTSTYAADYLNHNAIRALNPSRFATLLVGNANKQPTEKEILSATAQARQLLDKGYIVIYDADSNLAEYIDPVVGIKGLAMSSQENSKKITRSHFVTIQNNFMRMSAFSHAQVVIVAEDSLPGRALLLWGSNASKDGEGTSPVTHILTQNKKFSKFLVQYHSWSRSKAVQSRKLGIQAPFKKWPESIVGSDFNSVPDSKVPYSPLEPIIPKKRLEALFSNRGRNHELNRLAKFIDDMVAGTRLAQDFLGTSPGVGLMGSSKVDPQSAEGLYQVAYQLGRMGISVSTGGSGGAMWVANMGNKDGGGISIGVPIKGRKQPVNEGAVPTDDQTLTIYTNDYNSRIQFLIGNINGVGDKKIVFYVPGGSGTTKELAVHFMSLASQPNSKTQFVFFDHAYYEKLYQTLKDSGLPESVANRIHLIRNESIEQVARDTQTLIADLLQKSVFDPQDLIRIFSPSPSTTRNRFPIEKFIKKPQGESKND